MSVRRLAPADQQPASFVFSEENGRFADAQVAKYPEGRQASAVIALLWQAQKQQGGWLPKLAIEAVAVRLGMPIIRVMEVATFYTMFNLEPVGRYFVQLCGTVPCHVMGAIDLKQALLERVGDQGHVTADGLFSWLEVECLGACCNAPMVQINDDYHEDLTPDLLLRLLDDLAAGRPVTPGPQNGRRGSEPQGAVDTLLEGSLYDGSVLGSWRKRFEKGPAGGGDDGAANATGPNDPKPAKPDAGRAEHKPVASAPVQRAQNGENPAHPAEQAGASDPSKASVAAAPPSVAAAELRETPPGPPASSGHTAETQDLSDIGEPVDDSAKPELLSRPPDGPDDLKRIRGVGPEIEALLNGLGVFHYRQIAGWSADNLRWVDQHMDRFKGRAARDRWIVQATVLGRGGSDDEIEAAARGDAPVRSQGGE